MTVTRVVIYELKESLYTIVYYLQLTRVQFQYDSTVDILRCLSETCKTTLRVLDIENSQQVFKSSFLFCGSNPVRQDWAIL